MNIQWMWFFNLSTGWHTVKISQSEIFLGLRVWILLGLVINNIKQNWFLLCKNLSIFGLDESKLLLKKQMTGVFIDEKCILEF